MIIDEGFGIVQINIDGYDIGGKNKLFYEYDVTGKDGDELYKGLLKIIHVNVPKMEDRVYNEGVVKELTKLEKVCALFSIRKREVLEKLVKGDEELMELKKNIEEISNDEDFYDKYTKTEIYGMIEREEGKAEGKEESKIIIAKKLLENDVSLDIISASTGLTKEKLESLK